MDVILWGVAKLFRQKGQLQQVFRYLSVVGCAGWLKLSYEKNVLAVMVKTRLAETSQRQGIPLRGHGQILSVTVVERREVIKERNGSKKYFGAESIGLVSNCQEN